MSRRLTLVALGFALSGNSCASSGHIRCKPTDNSIAICDVGEREECETRDDGCERCTCVPNRPQDLEHGPQ